jgi:hypothetical protein
MMHNVPCLIVFGCILRLWWCKIRVTLQETCHVHTVMLVMAKERTVPLFHLAECRRTAYHLRERASRSNLFHALAIAVHLITKPSFCHTVDGRNLAPPYLNHMSKARGEWDAREMRVRWERDKSEMRVRSKCDWDENTMRARKRCE